MIVIASVQHTGTWSTINLIEQLMQTKVTLLKDAMAGEQVSGLLQMHVGGEEGIHHRDKLKHAMAWLSAPVITHHISVVPVRDPMASVITRHNRHPQMDHRYIVDGFKYLAELHRAGAVNLWLCHDLIQEAAYNDVGHNLAETIGVEYRPLEWEQKNIGRDTSGLKKAYQEGDHDEVKQVLGQYWNQLSNSRSIRSFLINVGYEALPWM